MLAGIPILVAFKYYDVAQYVTELHFSQIVSINVVNEAWFQSLPESLQQIVREEGRKAERAVFDFGVANLERSNGVWKENGGQLPQRRTRVVDEQDARGRLGAELPRPRFAVHDQDARPGRFGEEVVPVVG